MISAIVLAAGLSKRMGQPKMLLPWGRTTVLGRVIEVLKEAEIEDIIVVTGGVRRKVEALVEQSARPIFNEAYERDEMLSSIQCGLHAQKAGSQAALICLGDQPQILPATVRFVCQAFNKSKSQLIVPSYRMRRGHPWLVARPLWDELLAMRSPLTPREFLNEHADEIEYVNVETSSVIEDLDTPEDYQKSLPNKI